MKSRTRPTISTNSPGASKPASVLSIKRANRNSSEMTTDIDPLETSKSRKSTQDTRSLERARRKAETVDLLEGFNVDPREKQFLLDAVAHYSTEEDRRMLEEAGKDHFVVVKGEDQPSLATPDRNEWDDWLEEHLILRKEVEGFAELHTFVADKQIHFTEARFRQYVNDIYDYARAIGMGHYQAVLEVKRTRAAHRQKRGLAKYPWLEDDIDKSLVASSVDHYSGLLSPSFANAEIARLHLKCIPSQTQSRKRKRTEPTSQPSGIKALEFDPAEKTKRHDHGREQVKTEIVKSETIHRLEIITPTKSVQKTGSAVYRILKAPDSTESEVSSSDESSVEHTTLLSASKNLTPKPFTKSPYFSPPATDKKPQEKKKRPAAGLVSCIPFPPLKAERFGLLQEKLADDPLRLLIGTVFLTRTHGRDAIPVFFQLIERYPTPEALAAAKKEDVMSLIYHLGFQSLRAEKYIQLANRWIHDPPVKGRRHRVVHYPDRGSHAGIMKGEILTDADPRVGAWEIGHITSGQYALDSWRIFCRDKLRGLADGWNGEGAKEDFQPEWMRVVPQDKELRAFLRWMWLKEGFDFDPITGDKEVASKELMEAAMAGRIAWDDLGGMRILDDDDLIPDNASDLSLTASERE